MRATFVGLVLAISLNGGIALAQTTAPPATPPLNPPRIQIMPPRAITTLACTERDCDRDGHVASALGGDDCNDNDATTYPGRAEVGDNAGHDEDCDARTYGTLDADGDGFTTDRFYNTAADGTRYAGGDCHDGEAGIRPTAQELPNRVDDDCDGVVDDLVGVWYTPR